MYRKYLTESLNFDASKIKFNLICVDRNYYKQFDRESEKYFLEEKEYQILDYIIRKIENRITYLESENIEKIVLKNISLQVVLTSHHSFFFKFAKIEYEILYKDFSKEFIRMTPFSSKIFTEDLDVYNL